MHISVMIAARTSPEKLLRDHAREINRLGVLKIGLFGSVNRPDFGPESDVDVFVEFDPKKKTYDNFDDLYELLSRIFERKIDLVTDTSLSRHLAPSILPTIRYVELGN